MNTRSEASLAEIADRRWTLIAVAVLLMALKSIASAAMAVVGEPYLRYLDWAELATALAAGAIVLWLLYFKLLRVPGDQRRRFLHLEGYVADTVKQAIFKSWNVTLLVLLVASYVSKRWFPAIPAEFFIQIGLAMMLGAFSLTFFVMNARSDDEEAALPRA